ncbi:hypothetical protein CEG14_19775 [Bordetella genomosp. 1]|uniref:Type III secretion chaperone SycN n=1 Tax=Bordetella genomosp. 1 TaxID=1395607 RepID=A0A261S7K1_9BORD|nr:hypothetical protein [Bordetella genomosp. 1]OZI33091.1 hypothetical protein CEG14_19775 [Bordetella genomosp. 1]OZI57196.1 hypothetical protein CAL27_23435 [Bordetella genomosp. 1]
MNAAEQALAALGQEWGFGPLALDERGTLALQAESGRRVGIERTGTGLALYVAAPAEYEAGAWLLRAFKRAHHSRHEGWPVQVALRNREHRHWLLALVRIEEAGIEPAQLRAAVDYLNRWLDAVRDATR